MLRLTRSLLIGCALLVSFPVGAKEPRPEGPVILTIGGNIARRNNEHGFAFDRALIQRVGMRSLRTVTNWTDGVKQFEGVWMRDILTFVGARGTMVSAVALNDYAVDIPMSDFIKYDVLLAMKMDGVDLHVRDKGPLWVIYPRDKFPELRNEQMDSRWVWQLMSLIVR